MKKITYLLSVLICFGAVAEDNISLAEARSMHNTQFFVDERLADEPVPMPPADSGFVKMSYQSNSIELPMLLSKNPEDGKKHPAIIWITGGESNSIGDVWEAGSYDNDQSASQYHKAGVIMAFPSMRGGNDNEGKIEFNYGEVDDIIAATQEVAKLPYVDASQIYLGGHSTGGTLALLTSEVASQTHPKLFKGVFSYGATGLTINEQMYANANLSESDNVEIALRAPAFWLKDIQIPTWLIEGSEGNFSSLEKLCEDGKDNAFIHCVPVNNHSHFSVLAPVNGLIAEKILSGAVELSEEEIHAIEAE